jgi:DNA-binding MarR family transcriptional regulator
MARRDRPDPARMEVWAKFLRAHNRLERAIQADLERERGLALAWYDVLLNLHGAPDCGLRMGELADRVMFTTSGLTRLVDRMAAAGLVERHPDERDRRVVLARLTPAGRSAMRRAAPASLRSVQRHFAGLLHDGEVPVLDAVLTRVLAALDTLAG